MLEIKRIGAEKNDDELEFIEMIVADIPCSFGNKMMK
jgi:isocitrate lyase